MIKIISRIMRLLGWLLLLAVIASVVYNSVRDMKARSPKPYRPEGWSHHDASEEDGLIFHLVAPPQVPRTYKPMGETVPTKGIPLTIGIDNNTYTKKALPEKVRWQLSCVNTDDELLYESENELVSAPHQTLLPGQRWVRYLSIPLPDDMKGAQNNDLRMHLWIYFEGSLKAQLTITTTLTEAKGKNTDDDQT